MARNRFFIKKYKKYKDKIYNYFWYRVNFNEEIAEDLCSEAFLRAFDKFDVFDKEREFQPWIYAIAKNWGHTEYYRHEKVNRIIWQFEKEKTFYLSRLLPQI